MRGLHTILLGAVMLTGCKAFALGIDIGPVHIHGTKVKVGSTVEFKIEVTKITFDEEEKDRVRRINGRRVGSDEKFDIRVAWADLDDDSKEVLRKLKEDNVYKMKLEKGAEEWRLHKIRRD